MNDSDWLRLARAPLIGAQSNLCPETGALYRRAISGHKLGARNRLCPGHMGAHAHTVTQGVNGYQTVTKILGYDWVWCSELYVFIGGYKTPGGVGHRQTRFSVIKNKGI